MGRCRAHLRFLIDLLDDSDDWFTSSHSASVLHSREGGRRMSGAATALRGGRTWWAHFEFTRINIAPIFLRKKIEEILESSRSCLYSLSVFYFGVRRSVFGSR